MESSSGHYGYIPEFNVKNMKWSLYKDRFQNYIIANSIKDDNVKKVLFLSMCSEESMELLNGLCIPDKPQDRTFDDLVKVLDTHFTPKQLFFPPRYVFDNARKEKGESMAEWEARVRQLASKCNYGSELSTVMRDRFIMGLGKGPVMDRLFEEDVKKLTFTKAVELATMKDAARNNYGSIMVKEEQEETQEIFKVVKSNYKKPPDGNKNNFVNT